MILVVKAIEKKQGESFVRMLTDCPFGIGELDEIEFKDYALAYVLNKFNTGIVLLWYENGRFKQKNAVDHSTIDVFGAPQIIIKRSICK